MVLGSATQKIQTIVELAEDLYEKVTELKEELQQTQETVHDVDGRVAGIEEELDQQRVILEGIANELDISIDELFESDENPLSGTDP